MSSIWDRGELLQVELLQVELLQVELLQVELLQVELLDGNRRGKLPIALYGQTDKRVRSVMM